MKIRVAGVALCVVSACVGNAYGQASITWMGPFPGGSGGFGFVESITPDGTAAAGRWSTPGSGTYFAFRWSVAGGMQPLTSSLAGNRWEAYAISPDGQMTVGDAYVSPSEWHACVWNAAGVQTDLGTLSSLPVRYSGAYGAANGVVAGYTYTAAGTRAFRWTPAGGMAALDPLPGIATSSALCISVDGTTVGGSSGQGLVAHATIWVNGVVHDLGTLPGDPYADVRYLSPDGTLAVGMSGPTNDINAAGRRAFRWTAATGMQPLFEIPIGYDLEGASADGTVVVCGQVWTESRGLRAAADVLADYGIAMTFASADAVSPDGKRLGGIGSNAGQRQGWIVTLPPGLACYANCDGSVTAPALNVADLTCFLRRFAAGDTYANCDGSTTIPVLNVADFTCFLQKFAAGCE